MFSAAVGAAIEVGGSAALRNPKLALAGAAVETAAGMVRAAASAKSWQVREETHTIAKEGAKDIRGNHKG
jgi:hypothetical protein